MKWNDIIKDWQLSSQGMDNYSSNWILDFFKWRIRYIISNLHLDIKCLQNPYLTQEDLYERIQKLINKIEDLKSTYYEED